MIFEIPLRICDFFWHIVEEMRHVDDEAESQNTSNCNVRSCWCAMTSCLQFREKTNRQWWRQGRAREGYRPPVGSICPPPPVRGNFGSRRSKIWQNDERKVHFLAILARGALHSSEKAYEIFSEQKDLNGFLMDFS